MIKYFFILALLSSFTTKAQLDLAIQKGHSDEIVIVEFSNSNKYIASVAANNEIIIWDFLLEKSITSFNIGEIEKIKGIKFNTNETELKVKTKRTTYFYNIKKSKLHENKLESDTLYRQKDYYFDDSSKYELRIKNGTIIKQMQGKRFKRYKKSVNYTNAPFLAFDVSKKHNLLVGVAKNDMIFVYNYNLGIKYWELKGHNSAINDIRFSRDGKYFATAGKDRSIIIWNTKTYKIEKRLFSNIYQKKTVTFNHDGTKIYVGDELGNIFEINLQGAFPSIRVGQQYYHAVNKIMARTKDSIQDFFIVSENNHVYQKQNVFDKKSINKYAYRNNAHHFTKERILESVFGVYQPPFGQTKVFDISPNHKRIAFTGYSTEPNITIATLNKKRKKHLFLPYNYKQWIDISFINDNELIALQDTSNIIYHWKFENKNIYLKTDTLPYFIKGFEYIGNNQIWLNTKYKGQYVYNLENRQITKKLPNSVETLFLRNNFMVLGTSSNSIILYDLKKSKTYFSFMGHRKLVTDVNFNPTQNMFISSSDDGSVKLWDINNKKLIVTIFPFKNNEFIFINSDNYYLSTKGALAEIGFKHNGQFFYPDQFDLKFNRPDIILKQLGATDPLLIDAYYKAYLRRLKKMNFTEDQLKSDYELPEIFIENIKDISNKTTENTLILNLKMVDKKYNLDRINVWVNGVAIYGTNGINIKAELTKSYKKSLKINLANGKNKIQVSVLNQTGAESFKKTIEITNTNKPQKPNLFVLSIGVSKHKNQNYNLNYADKDAIDITNGFKKSTFFNEVYTKTLTNEQVTLKNLEDIKPFLNKASINDIVLIFVAGHGVLDKNFNYYFASYDMDFERPSVRGIPYSKIEELLDGIKALKKLLFLDTCHSGELDAEDVEEDTDTDTEQGDIIFRAVGVNVKTKDNPLGLKSTNELMKSLFTDLRKGTGTTVISSSGGAELSIEGGLYKNGLFTYCLLKGLLEKEADYNKDRIITVSEIQKYVSFEVNKLSNGKQTPTSRIENIELDYRIW